METIKKQKEFSLSREQVVEKLRDMGFSFSKVKKQLYVNNVKKASTAYYYVVKSKEFDRIIEKLDYVDTFLSNSGVYEKLSEEIFGFFVRGSHISDVLLRLITSQDNSVNVLLIEEEEVYV